LFRKSKQKIISSFPCRPRRFLSSPNPPNPIPRAKLTPSLPLVLPIPRFFDSFLLQASRSRSFFRNISIVPIIPPPLTNPRFWTSSLGFFHPAQGGRFRQNSWRRPILLAEIWDFLISPLLTPQISRWPTSSPSPPEDGWSTPGVLSCVRSIPFSSRDSLLLFGGPLRLRRKEINFEFGACLPQCYLSFCNIPFHVDLEYPRALVLSLFLPPSNARAASAGFLFFYIKFPPPAFGRPIPSLTLLFCFTFYEPL